MNISICTLFEKEYHYGLAALINSVYSNGYTGNVYAGYKGELSGWAAKAQENKTLGWPNAKILEINKDLRIHFLPLETDYHLTNYKPDFMLRLFEHPVIKFEGLIYLDPDILVIAPWVFFEKWVQQGVALCEDVNSPLAMYHPRRMSWREEFEKVGTPLQFKEAIYANGGFAGVHVSNISFIQKWKGVQEQMAPLIGGLNRSAFAGNTLPDAAKGPFAPFGKTDQDALNITVEAWDGKVSFYGKEAMGFLPGAALLPHALGGPKPWHQSPFVMALQGRTLRQVDKQYWDFANGIILSQKPYKIKFKKLAIGFAVLLGRFYSRK